ncbi:MAG TPA: PDZ domain-containing protein, partial [Acidimicrobiales bacterium]|nr:PDZ domain-containing protein [Acidimicrobiales bacterium]
TIHIGLPGFLGVGIGNGSAGSTVTGAVVSSVQPSSPAAAAGLVAGDTITSIDGKAVDSAQTLSTLTKAHHRGDKVTVGWTDPSGVAHSAIVTLTAGPAD